MDEQKARNLATCFQLLDETGRLDECLARYPQLEGELRSYLALRRKLAGLAPADPEPLVIATSRRLVLSSLQANAASEGEKMPRSKLTRLVAPLAGIGLFALAVLGAGAAPGGIPGPPSGGGQESPTPTASADASVTPTSQPPTATATSVPPTATGTTAPSSTGTPTGGGTGGGALGPTSLDASATPSNHGQAVSQAVHDAQASSTPGAGRGIAVSEAACTAAHDRTTLPEGAQNAPGQQDREPKDCTHPNADGTPGNGGLQSTQSTPEAGATATSEDEGTSGPGNSGSHGNNGNGNK